MSMKEVSSDYLRARGLSESEILVYSTVLGLGNATIGEINLAIKMELPEIYIQMKQLEEIGYVKKIPGKVPRYIAMEPFLKDYTQLTSEMKLGLIKIKDNFQIQVEEFNAKIKTVVPYLSDFCEREKTTKLNEISKKLDRLEANLNQMIDNNFLQLQHLATTMSTWPSESIEQTIPAFEEDLTKSKDNFVGLISGYADSLVIDSREIRDKLEKATIHHKILVAERLEKLKRDIEQATTEMRDNIVKQNFTTSTSYGANLDEKDITARETAAQIISDLIRNVIILAREKPGDINTETAQMINNSLGPLFRQFDFLQSEVKTTLENLLEEHSEEATKYVRHVSHCVESTVPDVLEIVTDHLEESRDESARFINQKITDPFKELEKMKGDIAQDITIFKENLKKEAFRQDELFRASIADRMPKIEEKIDLGKIEIKDILSMSRIDVEDILQNLIKGILNENTEKIDTSTFIMTEAGTKLENTLANTIYLLDNTGKTFDGIVNMSDKVMPMEELEISLVYGDNSIMRIMKDMLLRAQNEMILVTPKVVTEFLYDIEKMPQVTNYQIVSKIEEEDVGLLDSLMKRGNVTTVNYKGMDYWIAIRDNEELLFAPKYHVEKNIGFITTNPKYYKFFYELANQKVFSKMKAEEFQ
ncbi:MAG TPA: helix-turn-helix domain-containing protein [candidate division Zixibacteria bacterium]|nr:helix-turn-helix domain-containing protein [candidate division Zixibacteria bacterium]